MVKSARFFKSDGYLKKLLPNPFHDLVLSPDNSKGSTLDPDTVAHEHSSIFFPDNGHGAANAAGFGWRNGG
jgi:hypothetical protein